MSATFNTYYLDSSSFLTATSVWLDPELSTLAPDGWYKFGNNLRVQSGGLLQEVTECEACVFNCSNLLSVTSLNIGIYETQVLLTTFTASEIIRFTTDKPIKIEVTYNGTTYEDVYSENFGFLQGGIYGDSSIDDCSGSIPGTYPDLPVYVWEKNTYINSGATETVVVATAPGVSPTDPGILLQLFPKLAPSPTEMTIRVTVFCPNTTWSADIKCPTPLTAVMSSTSPQNNHNQACNEAIESTYRYIKVVPSFGLPDVGDIMYVDLFGDVLLGAGFYRITPGLADYTIEVDSNGIIVSTLSCSPS